MKDFKKYLREANEMKNFKPKKNTLDYIIVCIYAPPGKWDNQDRVEPPAVAKKQCSAVYTRREADKVVDDLNTKYSVNVGWNDGMGWDPDPTLPMITFRAVYVGDRSQ